jgi:hypothetical protein
LEGERAPRLSAEDGEIHTVLCGRPLGLQPALVREFAANRIHLHMYGEVYRRLYPEWMREVERLGGSYFHLYPFIHQDRWISELSRYDAGWLHFFESDNQGEMQRLRWPDMNYPARMATLAVAGVPWLQRENSGHIVSTQSLASKLDVGIAWSQTEQLAADMRDARRMQELRANMWANRALLTFDHNADDLLAFFRRVIESVKAGRRQPAPA